jgi:hypothetical protein
MPNKAVEVISIRSLLSLVVVSRTPYALGFS